MALVLPGSQTVAAHFAVSRYAVAYRDRYYPPACPLSAAPTNILICRARANWNVWASRPVIRALTRSNATATFARYHLAIRPGRVQRSGTRCHASRMTAVPVGTALTVSVTPITA